jgi:UDP-N-acetylglucosamine 1-carboxyvinyltransferase
VDKIIIRGGRPLYGDVRISGAKNAALPLMAASLLTKGTVVLNNVPQLSDVVTMSHLLMNHGVKLSLCGMDENARSGHRLFLNASNIGNFEAPYEMVKKMRASVLVLGPLVARFGFARVSMPGGCAIGARPVDLHVQAMRDLGAEVDLHDGYIEVSARNGLRGGEITFPVISVGATENAIMAATLASGKTVIHNAAKEPEIIDLCKLLSAMGAKIQGAGSSKIEIEGVSELYGATHTVIFDRIEAGTYAVAAIITGGELVLKDIDHRFFENISDAISEVGGKFSKISNNSVKVSSTDIRSKIDLTTSAYPGFPTDMQAQLMALLSVSSGLSTITESIFENRFMHVPELNRMGADIKIKNGIANIQGVPHLSGAEVMATDLRASVSLVLAGLAAKGETVVNRVYHLDRGYEKLEEKLSKCGAMIFRSSSVINIVEKPHIE